MKYFSIITLFLLGCGSTQLQRSPEIEPNAIEQQIAQPLNACQRGKYYAMIRYKYDMEFILHSYDGDIALQAAKNLVKINNSLDEMTALGITRLNKKCSK